VPPKAKRLSLTPVRVRFPVQLSGDDDFVGVVSGEICMWVRFPGDVRLVEAAVLLWRNNFLLVFVHLAVTRSGAGGRPMRWCRTGSGARSSDWVVRRVIVLYLVLVISDNA
jgi:hypothetical protein